MSFLFPPRIIPSLRDLRGASWRELVDRVSPQDAVSPASLGFVLFMVRLGNCTTCHVDSYRALRGCLECARQTIRRFRGDDQTLLDLYADAHQEIEQFLKPENQS